MEGITKARELKNYLLEMEKLDEVSQIAYYQDIAGLTTEECETLEKLCDKAAAAIEAEISEKFNL